MNQTPFYGESGGQVGDTGEMRREGVRVTRQRHRRKRPATCSLTWSQVEQGTIKVGDPAVA